MLTIRGTGNARGRKFCDGGGRRDFLTIGGMALGGWLSGEIFDLTLSYTAAFVNGFAWNLINMAIVVLLLWRARLPRLSMPRPRPMLAEAPLVGRWPGTLR